MGRISCLPRAGAAFFVCAGLFLAAPASFAQAEVSGAAAPTGSPIVFPAASTHKSATTN